MKKRKAPVAFISYSWDSPQHKEWVLQLAKDLADSGIEVILDRWDLEPGNSLTQFMETSIARAEFVLVVCTPSYARRANVRKGGVGYEQQIISGHIASGLTSKRFIPILRRGTFGVGDRNALPSHLSGLFAVDMRRDEDEEFDVLVSALLAEKKRRPAKLADAPPKRLRRRTAKTKSSSERLATRELDGYELQSGVASAELYPKSYYIPSERRRKAAGPGDLVKVSFVYSDDVSADNDGLHGERMWVRLGRARGPYLGGKLLNQPLAQDAKGWPLTWGDPVLLLPEHIIDIE